MTNKTETPSDTPEAIEHAETVLGLTALVEELRSLRALMEKDAGRPVHFFRVAEAVAGTHAGEPLRDYLMELGNLLDRNDAEAIDADLDARLVDAVGLHQEEPSADTEGETTGRLPKLLA